MLLLILALRRFGRDRSAALGRLRFLAAVEGPKPIAWEDGHGSK